MVVRWYLGTLAVGFVLYALYFSPTSVFESTVNATTLPTSITISVCGDAIVSSGEVCDDGFGNNIGGYASSTAERHCNADCQSFGPYCGDGTLQVRFTEQCDDANNTSGDLCSSACLAETPAAPPPGGPPSRGSVSNSGGPVGSILSEIETKVVLRGKAIPNATLNILLDGQVLDTVRTDSNADFIYSTNQVTPGTATFGFWATDSRAVKTITTSIVFEVVQSAVTTVANILLPPSISLSDEQLAPGELLTVSGESVPNAEVMAESRGNGVNEFTAGVLPSGAWSLQIDTNSLGEGFHTVKPLVEINNTERSGYGKALSFYIGDQPLGNLSAPDVNDDGRINLVDFSIFLLSWNTSDAKFDFNSDSAVNLADFSILLFNWTG